MITRRIGLAALLALVFAAACGDGTGPDALRGAYVLQSVGGQPLPSVVAESPRADGGREVMTVLYGRLSFRPGGRVDYSVGTVLEVRNADGSSGTRPVGESTTVALEYEREGDRVLLWNRAESPAAPVETLQVRAGSLVRAGWTGSGCEECIATQSAELVYVPQ